MWVGELRLAALIPCPQGQPPLPGPSLLLLPSMASGTRAPWSQLASPGLSRALREGAKPGCLPGAFQKMLDRFCYSMPVDSSVASDGVRRGRAWLPCAGMLCQLPLATVRGAGDSGSPVVGLDMGEGPLLPCSAREVL